MDNSQIYDLADESAATRPARYALMLPNNRAVYCDDEKTIALVQRAWRALNGFDPETGQAGYDGDCILTP